MIGIRVDANEHIAMGHLIRCLSVAKQLRGLGEDVIFIISEEHSVQKIEKEGFRCCCLNNSYKEKNEETEILIKYIQKYSIKKMLIDSYEVTQDYMRVIRNYCRVIYIDDINSFRYPADMIINYTFKVDKYIYANMNYEEEIFLLGERYMPLRPEFSLDCIEIKESVENIFMTTGGSDSFDMIIDIIEEMQKSQLLRKIAKHIVVGKFYNRLQDLKNLEKAYENLKVYYDITDIWNVMRKCDIAVSAGGTTLAELCACGIPTVCFAISKNQLRGTESYARENIMLYAGNVMQNRDNVVDNVINKVEMLIGNKKLRQDMSQKACLHIDGMGALRIAQSIVNL